MPTIASDLQWIFACSVDDLDSSGQLQLKLLNKIVLICKSEDRLFAVDGLCTHANRSLKGGKTQLNKLDCPHHAACFDLESGKAVRGPAFKSLNTYPLKQQGNKIFLKL